MKLTWYGHSCFKLECEDGSVVFDPYAPDTVPGLELPRLKADMCICSHRHSDHFYPQGVEATGRVPMMGIQRVAAFHDGKSGILRGSNVITVIESEGLRAAHFGDLGHMLSPEQIEELGRIDVMLLPVGGYYTIDAKQAWKLVQAVSPRVVVPMHYRGEGFGFDNIAPVEDFLAFAENVKILESDTLEIRADTENMTAVLKCPVK